MVYCDCWCAGGGSSCTSLKAGFAHVFEFSDTIEYWNVTTLHEYPYRALLTVSLATGTDGIAIHLGGKGHIKGAYTVGTSDVDHLTTSFATTNSLLFHSDTLPKKLLYTELDFDGSTSNPYQYAASDDLEIFGKTARYYESGVSENPSFVGKIWDYSGTAVGISPALFWGEIDLTTYDASITVIGVNPLSVRKRGKYACGQTDTFGVTQSFYAFVSGSIGYAYTSDLNEFYDIWYFLDASVSPSVEHQYILGDNVILYAQDNSVVWSKAVSAVDKLTGIYYYPETTTYTSAPGSGWIYVVGSNDTSPSSLYLLRFTKAGNLEKAIEIRSSIDLYDPIIRPALNDSVLVAAWDRDKHIIVFTIYRDLSSTCFLNEFLSVEDFSPSISSTSVTLTEHQPGWTSDTLTKSTPTVTSSSYTPTVTKGFVVSLA